MLSVEAWSLCPRDPELSPPSR